MVGVRGYEATADGSEFDENWTEDIAKSQGRITNVGLYPDVGATYVIFKISSTYYRRDGATGIVDDSNADASTLIQAAIDQVESDGGGTILLKGATYACTETLTIDDDDVVLAGEGDNTVLDFVANKYINITGSLVGTAKALTVNAAMYDTSVTLASVTGLAAGDPVRLRNPVVFENGEINRVASVLGLVVTLQYPLRRPYLVADSAVLQEVSTVKNVSIRDLAITNGSYGVYVNLAERATIDNVLVFDNGYSAFWITYSWNVEINKCKGRNTGHHFVCLYIGSTDCVVEGFLGNECADEAVHYAGCNDCIVVGSIFNDVGNNGLYVSGYSMRCIGSNNDLYLVTGNGIRVESNATLPCDNNIFSGNVIIAAQAGITSTSVDVADNIYVNNNISKSTGSAINLQGTGELAGFNILDANGVYACIRTDNAVDCVLLGNICSGSSNYDIYIADGSTRVRVIDNSLLTKGLRIHTGATDTYVRGNYLPHGILEQGVTTNLPTLQGEFPLSNVGGGAAAVAPVINTSPGGVDIDANDEFAHAKIMLPRDVQVVVRIKVWGYSNVIEAANNMQLRIVAHGATSSELWSGNAIDVPDHPSEETGGIVQYDVIHWLIDSGDDAQIATLAAQDFVELLAVGEVAGAPDIATDALFGGYEIEYV